MLQAGLSPMLASTAPLPVGERWAYEIKWDGVRALVAVEGGTVRAVSRRGNDITGGYPELTESAEAAEEEGRAARRRAGRAEERRP